MHYGLHPPFSHTFYQHTAMISKLHRSMSAPAQEKHLSACMSRAYTDFAPAKFQGDICTCPWTLWPQHDRGDGHSAVTPVNGTACMKGQPNAACPGPQLLRFRPSHTSHLHGIWARHWDMIRTLTYPLYCDSTHPITPAADPCTRTHTLQPMIQRCST